MKLRSLGWQTDLIFPRFDGQVADRGDYLVVRTPHNPTYYWGNFLLFDRAPEDEDFLFWCEKFHREIGAHQPQSRHMAFGIASAKTVTMPGAFGEAGFTLSHLRVMTMEAGALRSPARRNAAAAVRMLRFPDELAQAVALQTAGNVDGYEPAGYRRFRERQMARYAAMQAAGRGAWFGAFWGDQLVADCGIFTEGTVGRYQHVLAHPHYRRQGLAAALIEDSARHAFARMGVERLVILADPDDVAIALYRAVGFSEVESTWQLQLRAPEDRTRSA